MKSDSIAELNKALSKAQGEMEAAKKGSINPHFKNKYADLADVIDAIREPFAKNNLSYVQFFEEDNDKYYLVTQLMHASGEWISGRLKLLVSKQDMQGLGAAITYARRFSLAAMAGLAQDDDDGETAVGRGEYQKPKVAPMEAAVTALNKAMNKKWTMDKDAVSKLVHAMTAAKWTNDRLKTYIQTKYSKTSAELTESEFNDIHDTLTKIAAAFNDFDK